MLTAKEMAAYFTKRLFVNESRTRRMSIINVYRSCIFGRSMTVVQANHVAVARKLSRWLRILCLSVYITSHSKTAKHITSDMSMRISCVLGERVMNNPQRFGQFRQI